LDFYLPEEKTAIQVSYDLIGQETRDREVRALVEFNKVFKLDRAIIVTYDEEETIEKEGLIIKVIPVWKWLLQT
jgi:predicted AAA+ superfamily ATPase